MNESDALNHWVIREFKMLIVCVDELVEESVKLLAIRNWWNKRQRVISSLNDKDKQELINLKDTLKQKYN